MSAAATAAGYLYFHRRLPVSEQRAKEASRPVEPRPEEVRTPRIEYRKRRHYQLAPAA